MVDRVKFVLKELNTYANLIEDHRKTVIADMIWCGLRFGASPSNYYHFDFRHATNSDRKTFITHRISNKLMKKYNGNVNTDVLYNKLNFADYFNKYCGRACFDSKTISSANLQPFIGQRIIYKPLRGGQGRGITVFH